MCVHLAPVGCARYIPGHARAPDAAETGLAWLPSQELRVLQLVSALTVGAAGCSSGGGKGGGGVDSGTPGTTGTGLTEDVLLPYEDALMELHVYARAGADHRVGEAARLVDQGPQPGLRHDPRLQPVQCLELHERLLK